MVLWILFEKCFYLTCRTWGHLENRTFSCPLQVFDINSSRLDLPHPSPLPNHNYHKKLSLRCVGFRFRTGLIHGSGKSRIRIGQWYGAFKWLSPSPTQNYRETPPNGNIKTHFPNVALSYKMKKKKQKTKLVNSDHSKMSLYMFRLNHCQNTQPRKKLLIKGFKTITAIKIFIISQIHSPHRISVPRGIKPVSNPHEMLYTEG